MILVSGATGLLGSHVISGLLGHHERVAALVRLASDRRVLREVISWYSDDPDGWMSRIEWRTGDLLDPDSLAAALEGIDRVINCAAIVSFDPKDAEAMIASNTAGTRNLTDAIRARGAQSIRLIHISSIAALGDDPGGDPGFLIDEDTPRIPGKPRSAYSQSKYASERIVTESGLDAVILNPGVILGPGFWNRGSSLLFDRAARGLLFYAVGGTGYVDVRDVADAARYFCDRRPDAGNPRRYVMVGSNLGYRAFFTLVANAAGVRPPRLRAGRWLTAIAWRADALQAFIRGTRPALTRETARAARRTSRYASDRIRRETGLAFRTAGETVRWMIECRNPKR